MLLICVIWQSHSLLNCTLWYIRFISFRVVTGWGSTHVHLIDQRAAMEDYIGHKIKCGCLLWCFRTSSSYLANYGNWSWVELYSTMQHIFYGSDWKRLVGGLLVNLKKIFLPLMIIPLMISNKQICTWSMFMQKSAFIIRRFILYWKILKYLRSWRPSFLQEFYKYLPLVFIPKGTARSHSIFNVERCANSVIV